MASPADLVGTVFPAVDRAVPLAAVEVASSTDLMEATGSPIVCGSQYTYDFSSGGLCK